MSKLSQFTSYPSFLEFELSSFCLANLLRVGDLKERLCWNYGAFVSFPIQSITSYSFSYFICIILPMYDTCGVALSSLI